jgi:hypothetical protein
MAHNNKTVIRSFPGESDGEAAHRFVAAALFTGCGIKFN